MTAASPKTDELVKIMVKAAREAVTGYPHTQTLTFQMRAALAALEAAGMVVVPREPTEAMHAAGWNVGMGALKGQDPTLPVWKAMLAAAPKP